MMGRWLEALHALLLAADSSNGVIAGSSTEAVGGMRAGSAMHTTTYATRNVSLLIRDHIAVNRSFVVHGPATKSDDTKLPLVLGFHGQSGTGWQQQSEHAFNDYAARDGWLVAYLDGMGDGDQGTGWNCGTAGDNQRPAVTIFESF